MCVSCGSRAAQRERQLLQHRRQQLLQSAALMHGYVQDVQTARRQAVDRYIAQLPVDQKIAQLFLINIEGNTVYRPVETVHDLYRRSSVPLPDGYTGREPLLPGGVLFFSYNIADTPEQEMQYIDSVYEASARSRAVPPFVCVDQEGGVVNRLRSLNGILPSSRRVADYLTDEQAEQLYRLQGIQLRALGFHLNLAPVTEVSKPSNEQFLGTRSYGDRERTLRYSRAAVRGYSSSGIGTVLKHFPGNTNTDPHTGLPEITWTDDELASDVIAVFKKLALWNPAGVLMSHARVKGYDDQVPACLSSYWVTRMLRQTVEYNGIVFSDDIFMEALQKNGYTQQKSIVMALEAGVNCIMLSEKRFAPFAAILLDLYTSDASFAEKVDDAVRRLVSWKLQCGILKLKNDVGTARSAAGETCMVQVVPVPPEEVSARLERFRSAKDQNNKLWAAYGA